MIEFMFFIWFIGWLYVLGQHKYACEKTGHENKWYHAIPLFFFWPHYLGYGD